MPSFVLALSEGSFNLSEAILIMMKVALSISSLLYALMFGAVLCQLLISLKVVEVEAMIWPRYSTTDWFHTIVIADYMCNTWNSAQPLQPKPVTLRDLLAFSH